MLVAQQVPATMKVILMKAHALTENAHIGLLVVMVYLVMILKCIELLTIIVSVVIFLCVANVMSLESINAIKGTCVTSQIMKERSLVVDNQLRVTVSC